MQNDKELPKCDSTLQIRLAEYAACLSDSNATTANFWVLTGIFMGFSAVLLGSLLTALISDRILLDLFASTITYIAPRTILIVRVIISLVGGFMLLIYWFLWRWLRRVNFLNHMYYERMREIEKELGMLKHILIDGIDCWDKKTEEERKDLLKHKDEQWFINKRKSPIYERSGRYFIKGILSVLSALWALTIFCVWFLPAILSYFGL